MQNGRRPKEKMAEGIEGFALIVVEKLPRRPKHPKVGLVQVQAGPRGLIGCRLPGSPTKKRHSAPISGIICVERS